MTVSPVEQLPVLLLMLLLLLQLRLAGMSEKACLGERRSRNPMLERASERSAEGCTEHAEGQRLPLLARQASLHLHYRRCDRTAAGASTQNDDV